MEIDIKTVQDAIVQKAVDDILSDEDIYARIDREIDNRIKETIANRVEEMLAQKVEEAVNSGLDATYHMVDNFGKKVGEETTIRERLVVLAKDHWSQRVSKRDGSPLKDSVGTITRAEYVMMKACGDQFSKDMEQHVLNGAGAFKDGFRKQLGVHIDSVLDQIFRVKSEQDQGKESKPWRSAPVCTSQENIPMTNDDTFTNGKRRVATAQDMQTKWGLDGKSFHCYLCGHWFREGDGWRWQYAGGVRVKDEDGKTWGVTNFMVCDECDGPDVIDRWKKLNEEFLSPRFRALR